MHLAGQEAAVWRAVGERLPDYVITMMMYGPRLLDDDELFDPRFIDHANAELAH